MEKGPQKLTSARFTIVILGQIKMIEGLGGADDELVELKLYGVKLSYVIVHSKVASEGFKVVNSLLCIKMDSGIAPIFSRPMNHISLHVPVEAQFRK